MLCSYFIISKVTFFIIVNELSFFVFNPGILFVFNRPISSLLQKRRHFMKTDILINQTHPSFNIILLRLCNVLRNAIGKSEYDLVFSEQNLMLVS